jgi:hypothetical protein
MVGRVLTFAELLRNLERRVGDLEKGGTRSGDGSLSSRVTALATSHQQLRQDLDQLRADLGSRQQRMLADIGERLARDEWDIERLRLAVGLEDEEEGS